MNTTTRFRKTLLCLSVFACMAAQAAEDDSKAPRLFDSEETLEVTLSAPWREIIRDKENQEPYPATISYRDAAGDIVTHQLTVERRGMKRQEACDFPPIRLRFEKDAVKGTMFRGQESLKAVTHCKSASRYDQYYRLEMLAYRMYNLITDYSFRVRPLNVTYMDSERDREYDQRFAFVIEDDSDLAKRNGMKKLRIPYILPSRFDDRTGSQLGLFQFMIGNLDWSALKGPDPEECCHNVKLVAPEPFTDDAKAYPVAYDFDSTGLVYPPYAAPPLGLGINKITQRLYRGYCRNDEVAMADVRQQFLGLEPKIMALIEQDEMLEDRSRERAGEYLQEFFGLLRSDAEFEENVVRKCRK